MLHITTTEQFKHWLVKLKDRAARTRIFARLAQVRKGNLGDCRLIVNGVCEMRISHGRGYRVYFMRDGIDVVLLLAGGDPSSQEQDIFIARRLANEFGRAHAD
jgi:putative addiction module killer protein